MDDCVSYLGKTRRRSAWKRKSGTQKTWRNFTFFTELKKQDRQDHEPNSLCSMQASMDRYLRQRGYPRNLFWKELFAMTEKEGVHIKVVA